MFAMILASKFAMISHFILWGGVSIDLGTTWHAPRPGFIESNPILGQRRLRQGAIVIGTAAALEFVMRKLEHNHPNKAAVARMVVGAEHVTAGIINLHRQRK